MPFPTWSPTRSRRRVDTARQKPKSLVLYISPFGTPDWMSPGQAKKHLEVDERRYVMYRESGLLTERQRQIGPPHIVEVPR